MNKKILSNEIEDIEISNVMSDINLQKKTITLILEPQNYSFREQIIDIIDLDYFDNTYYRTILKSTLKLINKYNSVPEKDTLKQVMVLSFRDKNQVKELHEAIESIYDFEVKDRDFVIDTTLDFFRKQSLKKALFKAAEDFDMGNFNEIANTINKAILKCETKAKGHDYLKDVDLRMQKKIRKPVPCLEGLNSKIGGGLAGGELAIVLSPTGGGKSMFLVKVGSEALLAGKKVVYYTLELAETAIGNRFDACFNNVPINMVSDCRHIIDEGCERLAANGCRLIITEFLQQKPTVNTLRNHLLSLKREQNFTPDVIIVDYADLMKATSSYSEKRHSLTDIYENLRGLANEFNCPLWTASQVNRGGYNTEEFNVSNISEDMGKANTADLILGVARPNKSKVNNSAKLLMMKNRNGADGYSLDMIFDTSKVYVEIISPEATGRVALNGLQMEEDILNNQ